MKIHGFVKYDDGEVFENYVNNTNNYAFSTLLRIKLFYYYYAL